MEHLPAILTSVGALLASIGGGIVYIVNRMDRKATAIEERQDRERGKFEAALGARIEEQQKEIERLRRNLSDYARHVGVLEGMLRQSGLEPPKMDLRL